MRSRCFIQYKGLLSRPNHIIIFDESRTCTTEPALYMVQAHFRFEGNASCCGDFEGEKWKRKALLVYLSGVQVHLTVGQPRTEFSSLSRLLSLSETQSWVKSVSGRKEKWEILMM